MERYTYKGRTYGYTSRRTFKEVCARLAEYEDLCLEPDEIKTIRQSCTECEIAKKDFELSQLPASFEYISNLLKAERDGKLLILPCKLGDTVYIVGGKYRHGCMETWINTGKFCLEDIAKLGDTVFVSLEKAQEAEAELKRGKKNA